MDGLRTIETRLAHLALWALVVFAPIETLASWQLGGGLRVLIHPAYLHSVTGMVLLLAGARHSLRARPRRAPGVLCVALAWWGAVGWRATWGRFEAVARGAGLNWGAGELWATAGGTLLTVACFGLSVFLASRADRAGVETPFGLHAAGDPSRDFWRKIETRLAKLTLLGVVIFAPVETIASWTMLGGARALIHPLYLVTFTAMVLMVAGAAHSLGARPRPAPALLSASLAWIASYGWRSTFNRVDAVSSGVELHYGMAELWATAGATALAVAGLALSLFLTYRADAVKAQEAIRARG